MGFPWVSHWVAHGFPMGFPWVSHGTGGSPTAAAWNPRLTLGRVAARQVLPRAESEPPALRCGAGGELVLQPTSQLSERIGTDQQAFVLALGAGCPRQNHMNTAKTATGPYVS